MCKIFSLVLTKKHLTGDNCDKQFLFDNIYSYTKKSHLALAKIIALVNFIIQKLKSLFQFSLMTSFFEGNKRFFFTHNLGPIDS